jgi:hypothetical protein
MTSRKNLFVLLLAAAMSLSLMFGPRPARAQDLNNFVNTGQEQIGTCHGDAKTYADYYYFWTNDKATTFVVWWLMVADCHYHGEI